MKSNYKFIILSLFILFVVTGISGCKKQTIKLNEKYKNKIDEVVLFVNYSASMPLLGISKSAGGGFVAQMVYEERLNHVREIIKKANTIVADSEHKEKFEKVIVKSIESTLGIKVMRVRHDRFRDYDAISAELDKAEVNTVMAVGYNTGFTPGISAIDVKMDVSLYNKIDGLEDMTEIYAGDFYYQTLPASSPEIHEAKEKLKLAIKRWQKDMSDDDVVPYPRKEIAAVEIEQGKYWLSGNGVKVNNALTDSLSEHAHMLSIDLANHGVGSEKNTVLAYHRNYWAPKTNGGMLPKSFDAKLLEEKLDRIILQGPAGSLFSINKAMEKHKDSFDFDGFYFGM